MKTILIVEDVAMNRELLTQLLEDNYRLLTADNGEEALAVTRERRPDLVLMDLSLPRVDGWEATRRIKADPALGQTPIIALTAHAMDGDEARARESGCDGYITKPIDEQLLLTKIDAFLGGETVA